MVRGIPLVILYKTLAEYSKTLAESGPWQNMAKYWQNMAEYGRIWQNTDRIWQNVGYCVLWTEELVVVYILQITGTARFGSFLFRVALVLIAICFIYYMYGARDIRETR